MCGFAGFLCPATPAADLSPQVIRMSDRLSHRGPDDAGCWVDEHCGIALAHRRLSILDLSHAGHQPMLSTGARYVIAFNGETYNHLKLRAELVGYDWTPRLWALSMFQTWLEASKES